MLQYGGRSALAKEQLVVACALDPWSVDLFRLAKPADARDAPAADPLARMPWRLDQMHLRFQALQRSKSWAEAEALGARMLALDPAHAVGRAYGQCLKELGRGADALAAWRRYLAASRDFDTIFVHIDIAKELEDQGDLVGAEQHFEQAAQSWQNRAMLECADFLVRRGRGRDALVWVNRSIERYGDPRQEMRLKSASVLLAGSPAPTDIDEAFAHIEQAQAALMKKSNEVWYLGGAIRRTGQHDRFLQLVGDSWTASEGSLAARIGILAAESGRAALAAQAFATAREGKRTMARAMSWVIAWQTLAARLGKVRELEPLPEELRAQIGTGNFIKPIDPLLRFLAGDIDREQALVQAGPDAVELRYYLGFAAAAQGDLVLARSDFAAVIATHPDWSESGGAKRFLAWLDAGAVAPAAPGKPPVSDF